MSNVECLQLVAAAVEAGQGRAACEVEGLEPIGVAQKSRQFGAFGNVQRREFVSMAVKVEQLAALRDIEGFEFAERAIETGEFRAIRDVQRRDSSNANCEKLCVALEESINRISVPYENWMPGGFFSQFTSGSGYSYVAKELISRTAS